MVSKRAKIAALGTVVSVGGLGVVAISSRPANVESKQVASESPKTEVRTEVVRKTVRVRSRRSAPGINSGDGSRTTTDRSVSQTPEVSQQPDKVGTVAAPAGVAAVQSPAPSAGYQPPASSRPRVTTSASGTGGGEENEREDGEDSYEEESHGEDYGHEGYGEDYERAEYGEDD